MIVGCETYGGATGGEGRSKKQGGENFEIFLFFFLFNNGISGSIMVCALYISLFSDMLFGELISSPR